MKTILQLFIYIIFGFNILFAQQIRPKLNSREIQPFNSQNKVFVWDVNNISFIRILDGVLLKDSEKIDADIVNRIIKISDVDRLNLLGLKIEEKPYMLLNTVVDSNRYFIYQKANLDGKFVDINLPIVINNKLITRGNYHALQNMKEDNIIQCKYKSSTSIDKVITPMGYVEVLIKE